MRDKQCQSVTANLKQTKIEVEELLSAKAALKVQLKAAASKSNKAIPVSFVLVDEQMVYFQQMPFVCMCICMARPICLLVLNEETRTLLATRLVGM